MRDRAATAVCQYLESPVQVLTLERAEYSALAERARSDAEQRYARSDWQAASQ
jgi:hypothetical protein